MADKYRLVRKVKEGAINREHRRFAVYVALRIVNGRTTKRSANRILRMTHPAIQKKLRHARNYGMGNQRLNALLVERLNELTDAAFLLGPQGVR